MVQVKEVSALQVLKALPPMVVRLAGSVTAVSVCLLKNALLGRVLSGSTASERSTCVSVSSMTSLMRLKSLLLFNGPTIFSVVAPLAVMSAAA